MRYVKKPLIIEATRYLPGERPKGITQYSPEGVEIDRICKELSISLSSFILKGTPTIVKIKTLEGWLNLKSGNWVIKEIKGEVYPCENEIFNMTYDLIS